MDKDRKNISEWLISSWNENTKEVYIQTTIVGVKVYDYEGNYKRTAAKTSPDDVFMTMYFQFALYDNKFFIAQNLAFINKPTPKDSVWSFAWVDSTYQKKRYSKKDSTPWPVYWAPRRKMRI